MTDLEPLTSARFQVSQGLDGLTIRVPSPKSVFVLLFLLVWLCGWAFGEVRVIRQFMTGEIRDPAFHIVWLLGWTAGGVSALLFVLWQLTGFEEIRLSADRLAHQVCVLGVGPTRAYARSGIQALRSAPNSVGAWAGMSVSPPPFFASTGSVAFDYGAKTIRLAVGLDEAEAKQLVDLLRKHLPQ